MPRIEKRTSIEVNWKLKMIRSGYRKASVDFISTKSGRSVNIWTVARATLPRLPKKDEKQKQKNTRNTGQRRSFTMKNVREAESI